MEITIQCPVCKQQQSAKLTKGSYFIAESVDTVRCIRCKVKIVVEFTVRVDDKNKRR